MVPKSFKTKLIHFMAWNPWKYYIPYSLMFNVYKNQPSRQTGIRNLTGPKTLPTILRTNMKIVTKYQISAINSC
jgi:hypothetical protein